MHNIIALVQFTFNRKSVRLFIGIFVIVFIVVTYAGRFVIGEFEKLKDGFLEDLSTSIHKKIQIGGISGDYLYNLNIKGINIMNRADNTIYANIPEVDIEYNILRIILDSKNGLNHVKTVTIKNFEIFLREGIFDTGRTATTTTPQESEPTENPLNKIKRLSLNLVNGKITRQLWGGRELIIENINGSYVKNNVENRITLSGHIRFIDNVRVLKADFSLYFYKTDNDPFTAGVLYLRNVRYGNFYLKEAGIGVKIDRNKLEFSTLTRSPSSKLLENVYHSIFEPETRYDTLPDFSGTYDFATQTLESEVILHSAPYTVNRLYTHFLSGTPLFKWGFYPQGSAKFSYNFSSQAIQYSAHIGLSNMLIMEDRITLSLSGNTAGIHIHELNYTNKDGKITGEGRYEFGKLVPEINLFVESYKIPIRNGIEISAFARTVQTSAHTFDVIFEDIDAPPFQKELLKLSFSLQEAAIVITSDSIINEKLKLSVTIPKSGGLIAIKLDFLDLPMDDVNKMLKMEYYYEENPDTEDRDRYVISGNISAQLGGAVGYSIDGNVNIENDEIRDKYLVRTHFQFQNNEIIFHKIEAANGNLNLAGKVRFDGKYIFPEFTGRYRYWGIDLSMRIITGEITRIEGLLNQSLTFHGTLSDSEIKFHFDFDDFIFTLGRKPIMLSDSFTLIYNKLNKTLTGGGFIIWHNIDVFKGKKTGVWIHFSLLNNILTAQEVVFFSDFSSKIPLNLDSGLAGFGKVWIDPEYSRVCVAASELEQKWSVYFSFGIASNLIETTVTFAKPFDFTRIDPDFYKKFAAGITRGEITGGTITALGPDYDVKIKAQLGVRDGIWNRIPFNGTIEFTLSDDILVMQKVNAYNSRGTFQLHNAIISMNDTWQIYIDGAFHFNLLNNALKGSFTFSSDKTENNNHVVLKVTDFMINNRIFKPIELGIFSNNMRFHDIDKDKWSIDIATLKSSDFIGKIGRTGNFLNFDLTYFINNRENVTIEGTVEGKKLNLSLYSTAIRIDFLNQLSTGLYHIDGYFRQNLNVRGTIEYPELFGYLKIIEGRFNIRNFINPFKDLKAHLLFKGRKLEIDYFEVENGSEKIVASGFANFEEWSRPGTAITLKTIHNKGLNTDFSEDMFRIKGRVKLDLGLHGESGNNTLSGKIILDESLIAVTPIRINLSSRNRISLQTNSPGIFDYIGLNIDLISGSGVDVRLNPEIMEMRLLEGGKLNVRKEPGYGKNIALTGFFEARGGLLKAYNSSFNIIYAKLEFKNEPVTFGIDAQNRRKNKIYLTLNTRASLKDERDERVDIYLDFNGEITPNILSNFNDYLVMSVPHNKTKKEALALLGSSGEGLSLLLSPILNVFRDQLGFIDRIEGKTQAVENINPRRSTDTLSQSSYHKLNSLHNTEIRIGKYLNIFGLFNNNFYLKYAYVFKQDPYGTHIRGYHRFGLDWTLINFTYGNILLQFDYSPVERGIQYIYQPAGMLTFNFLF